MFRQTIFGLSTALALLTATAYSSDDEEHRGISFLGTRMPILSSSSGGGGMTFLASDKGS